MFLCEPGEVVGWDSFMTEEKRKSSVVSKNFSTVFEIKRNDFFNIIQMNSDDFVNYNKFRNNI